MGGGSKTAGNVNNAVKTAGAGRIHLPPPALMRQQELRNTIVNDVDLAAGLVNPPKDKDGNVLVPEPREWALLRAQDEAKDTPLKSNEFYALEDSRKTRIMAAGFPFKQRHRPINKLHDRESQSYLNWLLGVNIRMRVFHRLHHDKLFDIAYDTIGVIESNLLYSISKYVFRHRLRL
jgi:hypothetical protein